MNTLGGDSSVTAELTALERRRSTLEELVAAARHIEALEQLLQKMLLLVKPSQRMPAQAQVFFDKLTDQTRALPDEEVVEKLNLLEGGLKKHVRHIREYAEHPERGLSGADHEAAGKRIVRLRRYGQTAVGLRVLLQKRGRAPGPLQLDLPQLLIQQRIHEIREKEAAYRAKIESEMRGILADIGHILAGDGASEAMRESLTVIEAELQRDLNHVRSGGAMEDMPSRYESIELSEEPQPVKSEKAESPEAAVSKPSPARSGHAQRSVVAQPAKVGWFRVLFRWVRTPWGVSWRQAKRIERRRRLRKPGKR